MWEILEPFMAPGLIAFLMVFIWYALLRHAPGKPPAGRP